VKRFVYRLLQTNWALPKPNGYINKLEIISRLRANSHKPTLISIRIRICITAFALKLVDFS